MTRCQVDQPFFVRSTLVADGEIDGRPSSKSDLPVALDSPEKPGPIRPKIESLLTISVARAGACVSLPCESKIFRPILQSAFFALYSFSASLMPLVMLTPRAPASPVWAPRNARFLPQKPSPASSPLSLEPQAES